MEPFVAGLQNGYEPAQWAALAHDLRSAMPFTYWMVDLPWPLQLARQVAGHLPGGTSSQPAPDGDSWNSSL